MLCSMHITIAQRPAGPPSGYGGKPAPQVGYGKISGTVVDENNEPVPYATVRLLSATDDKLINGTIAEGDGK